MSKRAVATWNLCGAIVLAAVAWQVNPVSAQAESPYRSVFTIGRFVLEAVGDAKTATDLWAWALDHVPGVPHTPDEQNLRGLQYMYGQDGYPQDLAKARDNLEAASKVGDLDAELNLGVLYSDHTIAPEQRSVALPVSHELEAERLLRTVANARNDLNAQYDLGGLLETQGRTVEAVHWYDAAAKNPNGSGIGISADADKARHSACVRLGFKAGPGDNSNVRGKYCTDAELEASNASLRRLIGPAPH